ncbi:hypothetical protein FACS189450_09540 [Spirochaetia bacterium]|nr:hypothetical protein FACS189450_09540 [Spirochaetia bacterium]
MKKLLILGASPDFVIFVESAKAKGLYTIALDGNPKGPAKTIADKSYDIDVRNIDEIEKICRKEKIDGIVTGCSEVLLESYVELANRLSLPCYLTREQLKQVRVKSITKEKLLNAGVKVPRNTQIGKDFSDEDLKGFKWPLIIKPEDGYGSKGIFIVENIEQIREKFDESIKYSSLQYNAVEEYCFDPEYNIFFWVEDGKPHILYISDRLTIGKDINNIGYCSDCIYQSKIFDEIYPLAIDVCKRIVTEFKLEHGTFSLQIFYSPENGIQVCELAGRVFGAGESLTCRMLTGISPEVLLIDFAIGKKSNVNWSNLKINPQNRYAILYMYAHPGKIRKISGEDFIANNPNIFSYYLYLNTGEEIHPNGNRDATVAYFCINCIDDLQTIYKDIYRNFRILDSGNRNLISFVDKILQ